LEESKSKTKIVKKYMLKSYNGHPALIIIDTPGYADTDGMARDE
jgi:hypothetical protein